MRKKERFGRFLEFFAAHFPEPETELRYKDPYQLLVAVILSAQCTDKRVNMVTPAFFEMYPAPEKLAKAKPEQVFPLIKSISYPNNKTKHLIGMARKLTEDFNSNVPAKVDELLTLPGVGRKTAHVIASVIFNQPVLAVDTHVFRVSKRIGLASSKAKTPLAVEKELMQYIPEYQIHKAHHWLILHGRYVCLARNPQCESCGLRSFCTYFQSHFVQSPHVRN
jgi:endonuclease III